MADTISAYSKTAASNTTLQSISCAEGMAPSDVNNWMRAIMQDLAELYDGTQSLATLKATTALSAADGSTSVPSVQFTSDTNTGLYRPAADTVGVVTGGTEQFRFGSNPIPGGSKNLFHNGDFAVAQRGTSVTGIGAGAAAYNVFDGVINTGLSGSETGRYTMSQSTTVPANTGHRQSMKVDITTADASIDAGHWYYLEMRLEAQNVSHLQYGESGAKPLTVSFWTRSTTTGDYQFLLSQPDGSRAYSTGYTISSADTWEKKTLTIPGDTGGTINNDTGVGLILTFMLTGGSSSQGGTEDAWAAVANDMYGAGQTLNLFSSTSNDWYMAGLQVEVGSVATDFEFEDYGTTLQKCQRYFERRDWADAADIIAHGASTWTNTSAAAVFFQQEMRTSPTITLNTASTYRFVDQTNSVTAASSNTAGAISPTTFVLNLSHGSDPTRGAGYMTAVSATYFEASAEL